MSNSSSLSRSCHSNKKFLDVALVGDSEVGKTSIIDSFVEGKLSTLTKSVRASDYRVKLI